MSLSVSSGKFVGEKNCPRTNKYILKQHIVLHYPEHIFRVVRIEAHILGFSIKNFEESVTNFKRMFYRETGKQEHLFRTIYRNEPSFLKTILRSHKFTDIEMQKVYPVTSHRIQRKSALESTTIEAFFSKRSNAQFHSDFFEYCHNLACQLELCHLTPVYLIHVHGDTLIDKKRYKKTLCATHYYDGWITISVQLFSCKTAPTLFLPLCYLHRELTKHCFPNRETKHIIMPSPNTSMYCLEASQNTSYLFPKLHSRFTEVMTGKTIKITSPQHIFLRLKKIKLIEDQNLELLYPIWIQNQKIERNVLPNIKK